MTERSDLATTLVDEVFRHTTELLRATEGPLLRASVSIGDARIELEWPTQNDESGGHSRKTQETETDQDGVLHVCAPMVGTFYQAPEPGTPAFVQPGDRVEPGEQVGILEAMKLMNPIQSDTSGTITEILIADGKPVEYGEPLIAITPDKT